MTQLEKDIYDQNNYYHIIVDGNRHNLNPIKTKKEEITLDKCKRLYNNIKNTYPDININCIKIIMTEFDYVNITEQDYEYVLSGDMGLSMIVDKTAYYYHNTNRLIMWENGLPIYENIDGDICTDINALADCLM